MLAKRPLKIRLQDGTLVEEVLPSNKREFELRCGQGLARHLTRALGTTVEATIIENDEGRGDIRLSGCGITPVEVQVVEAALSKMHEWASWAAQAAGILESIDTQALPGGELWFYDPREPRIMREHLRRCLDGLRPQAGLDLPGARLPSDGPLGRVQWCPSTNESSPFRCVFWPMTFYGLGISSAVFQKAQKPYPNGTCLLVVSTLDLSPGGAVPIPDLTNDTVEFVNDVGIARRFLTTQAHPFPVVWRSILMPWDHDSGDCVAILHGDEQGLRSSLTHPLPHT